VGNSLNSGRPTGKDPLECFEITTIETVQPKFIDSLHLQSSPSHFKINRAASPAR